MLNKASLLNNNSNNGLRFNITVAFVSGKDTIGYGFGESYGGPMVGYYIVGAISPDNFLEKKIGAFQTYNSVITRKAAALAFAEDVTIEDFNGLSKILVERTDNGKQVTLLFNSIVSSGIGKTVFSEEDINDSFEGLFTEDDVDKVIPVIFNLIYE